MAIEGGEIYRIYSHNEKMAVNTFINACKKFSNSKNDDYKSYWDDLMELVQEDKFTLLKVDDFIGIRKI